MHIINLVLSLSLVFPLSVIAQSSSSAAAAAPSSTAGIPTCVIACSTQAATSGGCSSYTDVACVCTSQGFQQAADACLSANCTVSDQQAALALQSALCAAIPGALSIASSLPPVNHTGSASSTSSMPTTGSAASSMSSAFSSALGLASTAGVSVSSVLSTATSAAVGAQSSAIYSATHTSRAQGLGRDIFSFAGLGQGMGAVGVVLVGMVVGAYAVL